MARGGAEDIHFTWCGFDEMDEVQGDGSAEIAADGSIGGAFAYREGDEAIRTAGVGPFFSSLLGQRGN